MSAALASSDVEILNRLIRPDRNDLPVTAARAILKIDFTDADYDRMRELSAKARDGTLTPSEQTVIESYERVGHLLGLLHSKARRALKQRRTGD
jgi:hypothetical protein